MIVARRIIFQYLTSKSRISIFGRATNFNAAVSAKVIVVAHDKRQYLTMNTAKPLHVLLASQKFFFKGILRSRRLFIIAVVLLGIGGVHQRENASQSDGTSTPGATPPPSATLGAPHPHPPPAPPPPATLPPP